MKNKNPKRKLNSHRDNQYCGLVFSLPLIIGLILIFIPVFISGIQYSFNELNIENGVELNFVGIANYKYALRTDPNFTQLLISDVRTLITTLPVIMIFSLFIAVVLNLNIKGRGIFRTVFFLPVIVCTGMLAEIDSSNMLMSAINTLSRENNSELFSALGDTTTLLQNFNLDPDLISFLSSMTSGILNIVNRSGVQILIFLAGIQSVSPSIYEAALVEGASSWETFWKITLPMLSPMMIVNVIYTFVESITRSDTALLTYINESAFNGGKYGEAAAMAWLHFLVILVLLSLVSFIFVKIANRGNKGVSA